VHEAVPHLHSPEFAAVPSFTVQAGNFEHEF